MEAEVVQESSALVVRERDVALQPIIDVKTAMSHLKALQDFVGSYLQPSENGGEDGGDYGTIPGTKRKSLFKSGAEKLCEIYGLYDEYEFVSKIEDWDRGLFDYTLKCVLRFRRNDSVAGTGMGSCSSYESKYRWRDAQRQCPACGSNAIIKGKDFNNTGKPTEWLCYAKKGGCGAKFRPDDPAITGQQLGRVENPDLIDAKNTVLKMAKKRAKIDAVIGVTRSSGIFTQDLEDMNGHGKDDAKPEPRRATEDLEFGSSGNGASAGPNHGTTRVETKSPTNAPTQPEPASGQPPAVKMASTTQAQALHRKFRDALPFSLQSQADALLYSFLQHHGCVDGEGKPSALAIPQARLKEIGTAALDYARSIPTSGIIQQAREPGDEMEGEQLPF